MNARPHLTLIIAIVAGFGLICSCGDDAPPGDDDDTTADDDDAVDDDTTDDDDDMADDDDVADDDDNATLTNQEFWAAMVLFLCQLAMECWPDVVEYQGWESAEDCIPLMTQELQIRGCVYSGANGQECLEGIEGMTCPEFELWLKKTSGPCVDAIDC